MKVYKFLMSLSCYCLCLATCAVDNDKPLENWTAEEVRRVVVRGAGIDYGALDEVLSFVGRVKALNGASRLKLEANICEIILALPAPEHECQFDFVLALKNRRSLFAEMSDFSFWRTNRVAMLQLADCIGMYCNIETNAFRREIQEAYELDKVEWDREAERHEREGSIFVVKPGRNMTRVHTKFRIAKSWNPCVSSWRNAVLDIYSKHVLGYIDVISENERGLFVDEFTRRAKLTQEEKRQLFGSLPEKTEGVVDGSTTNFFCTTPQTFRIIAALGTDPFQPDTDGDGMDDGWEARYGFDPTTHNDNTVRTDDDADADSDGDGLTNAEECAWGTDPGEPDSDNDGVTDNAEIAQNSDPADPSDMGKPNSRTPVQFFFGDHSTSHSEKYRFTVSPVPIAGEANPPRTFSWVNANYGECETRTAMLTPGHSYEVRLAHASTNRSQGPDYDYTLNAVNVPQSVIVSDPDNLLGVHSSSSTFTGEGLVAILTAYKVDVAICSPDDSSWPELDVSRVLLDDEELRIKVTVTPQMASLAACRQKFGDSITVKTSGTCPQGVAVSLDDAQFSNGDGKSDIRISRSFPQLKQLGLLPSQDDDGIDEMAWIDMGNADPSQSSNLTDSEAFATIGYQFRGKATGDTTKTLESSPPNTSPSDSFFKAAGCEIVLLAYGGSASEKRQIMNQCDVFYYSGHGHHDSNDLAGGVTPAMAQGRWNKDLKVAVISGCSVLDINDYNGHYGGSAHTASPGRVWEAVGPPVFLGYNYSAPGDAGGAPARIIQAWIANRSSMGNANAWMKANADNRAWNACAIVKGQKYVYFKSSLKGLFKTQVEVSKESW